MNVQGIYSVTDANAIPCIKDVDYVLDAYVHVRSRHIPCVKDVDVSAQVLRPQRLKPILI